MDLTGIATVALAVVTFLSLAVAIIALRRASMDAKAARNAELSWNVYQAYDSRELREGRRALNTVSRKKRPRGSDSRGSRAIGPGPTTRRARNQVL
jgi:hypothetical protein